MGDQDDPPPEPASLEDVLITGQLSLRPSRPPDHVAENRALAALAGSLAEDPEATLRQIVDLVLELCRADSAGISVLEQDGGRGAFRWPAIAGAWAGHTGGTIGVEASPSGVVIDLDSPQLFAHPERYFGHAIPESPAAEALIVPFRRGGRAVGMVWAVVHSPGPGFVAEDVRLLTSLANFAAAAQSAIAARRDDDAGRALAEQASEAYARDIVDTMRVPLLVLDPDLRVLDASREFYRNFAVSPAETEGVLVYELGNRQWDIPRLRTLLEEILPRESTFRDFEVEHTFERIGRKVMLLNAREVHREAGGSGRILLVIEDVTERRDAEEARAEAEARFTEMVKNVRDHSVFLTDPEGVITSWNVAAERILGYTEAEAVGRHYSMIFSLEDVRSGVPERELRQAREEGRAEDERWHVRKGGEPFWALGIVTPLHDPGGRRSGYSKILRDMTERKRAEESLAAELDAMTRIRDLSDRLLRASDLATAMGEVLETAMALHGTDRGTLQVYDPAVDGLRYAATRGFDEAALAAVPTIDREFHSTCAAALRAGEPVLVPDIPADPRFAAHCPTADALGYRAAFSFPLTTRRGEILGVLTVHFRGRREPAERESIWAGLYAPMAAHLIERRRAEEALRASEEKYRELFDRIDEGFCIIEVIFDGDGPVDYRFVEVNPAFERHTGIADAAGRLMRDIAPGHERHWFETYGEIALTGRPIRSEAPARALGDRWYDFTAFRVGEPSERRVAIVFSDITERKRREERRSFLLRLGDALGPLADPVAIQAEACRVLGEHLGVDRAYYVEIDEAGGQCRVRRDYLRGDSPSMAGEYRLVDYGWSLPIMRAGRTIVFEDVDHTDLVPEADRPALRRIQIVAHVAVPLVKAGELVGCFCVTEPATRSWTAAEVGLVRETAERTWAATERAKAEATLRESEARLAAAFAALPMGVGVHDADGRFILVNDGMRRYLPSGVIPSRDDDSRRGRWHAWWPDGRPVEPGDFPGARALRGETVVPGMEILHRRDDGTEVWTQVSTAPVRDPEGRIVGAASVVADIDELKRAGAALRASEERLRLALAAARMGTWRWQVDADRHDRDANLNRLLGRPAEASAGPLADFLACLHPEDRGRVADAFHSSIRLGHSLGLEFRVVWPDGTVRWLRDQGDVFGGPEGRYLAGACLDVTDLKEAEAELRAGEEEFRVVTDLVPDLLWRLDLGTNTGWVNRRWVEYTGLGNDVVHPWGWMEAVHPDDRENSRAVFERGLASGVPFRFEHRLRRAEDGRYRWFLVGAVPLRDADGRISSWFGAVTDVDDQKAARDELELRVAARTAELAAEIERRKDLTRRLSTAQEDERKRVSRDLHDTIGQLMAGLSLAFKAVELSGHLPPTTTARLAEAQRIADSLGREVHGLAVRLRPTSLDDFGLVPALEQLVAECSSRTGIRIDLLASGLGPGRLTPVIETTIYRVVQEALTNVAKHARASTTNVVVSRPDGYVLAIVEDDGVGFDPGTVNKGRLGLVGMEERVALVGGTLEVESSPGAGTTVFARIPIPRGAEAGDHGG